MTRLIDLLCDRHRQYILDTRLWPADCPIGGTFGHYLNCPDCGNQRIPGHPFDDTEQTAVHEAGHAVMHLIGGATVEYAILNPGQHVSGSVHFCGDLKTGAFLTAVWAGAAANLHWAHLMRMCDDAATVDMVAAGYGDLLYGLQHVPDFGPADAAHACEAVADRWDAIERVADMLLARGRLSGDEIADLAGLAGCNR